MPVKGDEVLVYQCVPRIYIIVRADGKQGADFVKTIIRKAGPIPNYYQKQIEDKFMMSQRVPKSLPQKLVTNPRKSAVNLSDTITYYRLFLYHNTLQWL